MDNHEAHTNISSMRNQMFVTFSVSNKVLKKGGFRASIEIIGMTWEYWKSIFEKVLNLFCKFKNYSFCFDSFFSGLQKHRFVSNIHSGYDKKWPISLQMKKNQL